MFKENDKHMQVELFNSLTWMNQKIKEKLLNSWAPIFYEHVFVKINENLFSCLYCLDNGRPNFPINILLSLEFFKHWFDYTDEVLLENYYFNYQINFALGIRTIGEVNLSPRTLYEFRERLYRYALSHPNEDDLIFKQFIELTKNFSEILKLKTNEQRMDSTFVSSNIKKAGRLSLAYDVLVQAVKSIPEAILTDSLKKALDGDFKADVLYRIKANETDTKLKLMLNLCQEALSISVSVPELFSSEPMQILKRFLLEQVNINEDGSISAKGNSEISSNSLQSAYDTNATFRSKDSKKHSGYVVNLAETCNKDNSVQLITDYKLAQNIESDVDLIKERLPIIKENTNCTDMYTDGGYYGSEVIKTAEAEEVNMHFTDMTGRKAPAKFPISEFDIDKNNIIQSCPAGNTPKKSSYSNQYKAAIAHFDLNICDNCKLRDTCPVNRQKKTYALRVSEKSILAQANRLKLEANRKENTSKRAAIEGTNSAIKRSQGAAKLEVRGQHKCDIVIGLKVIALNIKRVAKSMIKMAKKSSNPKSLGKVCPILAN